MCDLKGITFPSSIGIMTDVSNDGWLVVEVLVGEILYCPEVVAVLGIT